MDLKLFKAVILVALSTCLTTVSACSEMHCAPIISKCQLLDACRCEPKLNYTCYKTCSHCLGDYYTDCCSCVGACPEEKDDKTLESHVKLFATANEDLFDIFTNYGGDVQERFHVLQKEVHLNNTATINCTMAYLASCVNMSGCESACISMGASGYRWFHIGCCECVGKFCVNFGLNEIRCHNCPEESDQVMQAQTELF